MNLLPKKNNSWILKYVAAATAETDVPSTVAEFISQRRRWLNGSFFAGVHALLNWHLIFRSGHSLLQKLLLCAEFIYNFVSLLFNWFSLGNFYLGFYFITGGILNPQPPLTDAKGVRYINLMGLKIIQPEYYFEILLEIYMALLVFIFITSLGNRPQGSKFLYIFSMFIFSLIMIIMTVFGGYTVYQTLRTIGADDIPISFAEIFAMWWGNPAVRDVVVSILSTYGMYTIASIIYLDPWHILTSMLQYTLLLPSFVNILMVYAFCNIHDVSWGTKGDNTTAKDLGAVKSTKNKEGDEIFEVEMPTDKQDINDSFDRFYVALKTPKVEEKKGRDSTTKQEDYFRTFRTRIVLSWLFTNALLCVLMTHPIMSKILFGLFNARTDGFNPYLRFIFYSVALLSACRFLGAIGYHISRMICG